MSGIYLSILAFAVAAGTAFIWFRLLSAVALPKNRTGFVLCMVTAICLAVGGLVTGSGAWVVILSSISMVLGGLFLSLVLISGQKGGSGNLQLGSPLLSFSAPDQLGDTFDSSSLDGRPILLKFFRGHW